MAATVLDMADGVGHVDRGLQELSVHGAGIDGEARSSEGHLTKRGSEKSMAGAINRMFASMFQKKEPEELKSNISLPGIAAEIHVTCDNSDVIKLVERLIVLGLQSASAGTATGLDNACAQYKAGITTLGCELVEVRQGSIKLIVKGVSIFQLKALWELYQGDKMAAIMREMETALEKERGVTMKVSTSINEQQILDVLTNITTGETDVKDLIKVRDIPVKTKKDKKDCLISGMTLLPDGKLILADMNNHSIKMINTKYNTMADICVLDSEPHDVTAIGDSKFAVTVPYKNQIQIYKVNAKLKLINTLETTTLCFGIAYANNKLFVTTEDESHIYAKSLTLKGVELNVLYTNKKTGFCGVLSFIGVDENGDVYVSDRENSQLTRITHDGDIKAMCDHVERPTGVTFGAGGVFCVCDRTWVGFLPPDLKTLRRYKCNLPLDKIPICYNSKDDTLMLGGRGNEVSVYKLPA